MPQSAPSKTSAWCNKAETVLIAGSIGSSVAAVVLQQVTFAAVTSIQLSFVVGLSSWNRKRCDEINQQNQAVITQLQQQFLQGKQSFEQVSQATQQLPTYKEIGDLQHHIERLESDHQKHTNQLHGDLRNQENQLSQLKNELTSLHQSLQSASPVDVDLLQDRIHNLKAHFEIKFKSLEEKTNQSLISQLENRLNQVEESISQSPVIFRLEAFNDRIQSIEREIKNFENPLSSKQLKEVFSELEILFIKTRELETLYYQSAKSVSEVEELSELIQSEIDDLDRRNQNLSQQIVSIRAELDDHRGVTLQRFQANQVELTSYSVLLDKEIKNFNSRLEDLYKKYKYLEERVEGCSSTTPANPVVCEWCSRICKNIFIGGFSNNCSFCSKECMRQYEWGQGIEGH